METGPRGEWPATFVVHVAGQELRAAANAVVLAACEAMTASSTSTAATPTTPCPAAPPCPTCPYGGTSAASSEAPWGGNGGSDLYWAGVASSSSNSLEEDAGLLGTGGEAAVSVASAAAGYVAAYAWPYVRAWVERQAGDNVSTLTKPNTGIPIHFQY